MKTVPSAKIAEGNTLSRYPASFLADLPFFGLFLAMIKKQLFLPDHLYAVTGWPLGHSLSPLLHNTGFQTLEMPAVYIRVPIPPEKLNDFVTSVRTVPFKGVSVTIPHKSAIIPYLDRVTDEVKTIGACNTLYWQGDALCGDNTDCAGFLAPLAGIDLSTHTVLLLGAGGAARAALCALRLRNVKHIIITTPGNHRHKELSQAFAAKPCLWEERYSFAADLIVNATPLGMKNAHESETPYDFTMAPALPSIAYDIVYTPKMTRFLREAASLGIPHCISGEAMFFAQGNRQFQLWTGKELPKEAEKTLFAALASS